MRLIQATVSAEIRSDVERVLVDREIDFFATKETGTDQYSTVVYISIPEEEVEAVLGALYEAGLDTTDHVVIIDTEVDIFGQAEASSTEAGGHARIAAAELKGKTEDLIPDYRTFVTMMVLSTIVATTGVLLDSSAVVVGSMVLAPLYGPAVSASVGTVIDESDLFWRGIRLQVLGVLLAVTSGSLFAWVLKSAYLIPSGFALTAAPQVVDRLSPDLLSLVVALVAGVAGVISIATATGRALVGVMMAAALLPPAAVVGVGVAWGEPTVALQSSVLLLVNLLGINFAGLAALWYLGYRPQSWIRIPQTRRALLKRGGVLLVAILVTSAFLWNVTYASVERTQLEDSIEEDVSDHLAAERYAAVSLVDVQVVQDRTSVTAETEKIVITIGRPPGDRYPELHEDMRSSAHERAGDDVTVEIQVALVTR